LKNFDINKVISISSVPQYNEDARKIGVRRVVVKDYQNLENFAIRLKMEISNLLTIESQ
jgi:hypothetical protein